MPNIDASDYIRRRRLATIQYANQSADQTKFRALTRFDSYSTSTAREVGIVCNDECRTTQKDHNIFAAQKYLASKVPHFNDDGTLMATIDFTNKVAGLDGFYVLYRIPKPTKSIIFTYKNIPDNVEPEIDSATFNFEDDSSTLLINNVLHNSSYNEPYFSNYNIYTVVTVDDGDTVTLNTNSHISGQLFVGYY